MNLAYTAGRVVEVLARSVYPTRPLFERVRLGLGLTLMRENLPAVIWVGMAVGRMVV